jgi:hypothetical protein
MMITSIREGRVSVSARAICWANWSPVLATSVAAAIPARPPSWTRAPRQSISCRAKHARITGTLTAGSIRARGGAI